MAFDFKKSLIKVQGGRQYLPVSARIVWFREHHPDWAIVTEPVEINHEKQYAVFRATVFNAEGKIMATGTKKEDVKGFGDFIEKAETGAVGRALALCGFGTQFSPELDEVSGGRLADSPQPMGGRYGNSPNSSYGGSGGYRDNSRYGGDGNRTGSQERDGGAPRAYTPAPTPPAAERRVEERRVEERKAEPAAPASDEEDAFDNFSDVADTDNPFADADTPAAPLKNAGAKEAPKAEARADGPPACVSCGKALTKAQQDLSIRNYGEALCPTCQREKRGSARPAAVA